MLTTASASAAAAWLRGQRRSIRCILVVLCSPVLIPILCAIFPFLCAAEACFRLCCKKGHKKQAKDGDDEEDDDNCSRLLRCEEGRCKKEEDKDREEEEVGSLSLSLLQRYLEDQLRLAGSVYECGDEDDYSDDNNNTPLLLS